MATLQESSVWCCWVSGLFVLCQSHGAAWQLATCSVSTSFSRPLVSCSLTLLLVHTPHLWCPDFLSLLPALVWFSDFFPFFSLVFSLVHWQIVVVVHAIPSALYPLGLIISTLLFWFQFFQVAPSAIIVCPWSCGSFPGESLSSRSCKCGKEIFRGTSLFCLVVWMLVKFGRGNRT